MNKIICDIECTISNKGNAFDLTNKLVVVGILNIDNGITQLFYYPNREDIKTIQEILNGNLFIGFNAKFDLHWLRRTGIDISNIKVWDCQIAEFLLNNQKTPYPSLNDSAAKYGLKSKLDVVKTEFWDKGIDTNCIPHDILSNYLTQDLVLTQQVFEKQRELFSNESKAKYPLFKLQCMDLLTLEEIEWNGIYFNTEKARNKAKEVDEELINIKQNITDYIGNVPFNLSSNDHVSCILYGGIIFEDIRIPIGVYKSGSKVGQTRYKVLTKQYELPRLVEPLKGTESKFEKQVLSDGTKVDIKDKPTHWKVNETVLRKLKLNKEAKKVVNLLNRYGELEKLKNSYLIGWSDLINEMHWEKDMVHGNLNQCSVITGRLSSTKPNMQNADPLTKTFMRSRYE